MPHDSPVQVSVVKEWLQVTAEDLGALQDAVRVLREKAGPLAGLLVLGGVPPAEIETPLPGVVPPSLRKARGPDAPGGFLGRRRAGTPSLPRPTPDPPPVADI